MRCRRATPLCRLWQRSAPRLLANGYDMTLVRAIGRWALAGLVVNDIIGSSIFGLPGELNHQLGPASPIAMVVGALAMAILIACAAEVGSQFPEPGGAYLYVRRTFGRFAGLQVAWFWLLAMIGGLAASANLFVTYLGGLVPALDHHGWQRAGTTALLIAIPAIINYRGVRSGAALSSVLAVAKLLALGLLVALGLAHFGAPHKLLGLSDLAAPGWSAWLSVLLALLATYGGWEDALATAGETREPRRSLPFALAVGLLVATVLYTLLQYVTAAALGTTATERPLADVAALLMGDVGRGFVTVAAMLSAYGYITAAMLAAPRLPYSLAVEGDCPSFLATLHHRFHTPVYPIVGFALIGWLLAISGTFLWAIALSAGSAAIIYTGICAALLRLRVTHPAADAARVPYGPALAVIGIALCVTLLAQVDPRHALLMLLTAAIATANWLWAAGAVRRRRGQDAAAS